MDTKVLIPTIAKKYNADVSTDDGVMELFNSICVALDENKNLLLMHDDAARRIDELYSDLSTIKTKLCQAESAVIEMTSGKMLSKIVKDKNKRVLLKLGMKANSSGVGYPGSTG